MEKMWYYSDNGTDRKGPIAESELRGLALPPSTLVWSEGMPNWAPLSSVVVPVAAPSTPTPLRVTVPATMASAAAPAATPAGGGSLPEGLTSWMTFVGVMNIIGGVFACLSCIGLLYGIPMIMGGAGLLTGKNLLAALPSVEAGLVPFFEQLRKAFKLIGWAYILMLVVSVLIIIAYAVFFAAMIGTVMHNMPR